MSTSSSSLAGAAEPAQIAPAGRVGAAFLSPAALFEDIRRSPSWWPAFLLLFVAGLVFCFAVQSRVGWKQTYDNILSHNPKQQAQFANMQPPQAASAKALGARITAGVAWGFPVLMLLTAAISAAVLLGTLNFGFGGKARFADLFAVYMYASLPFVLHSLLAAVSLFAGLDSGAFFISNPVGSNPGYYLPPETAPWILTLAGSLDLFTIWMLALMVIGCSVVAKVSRSSAGIAVIGWWVLMLIAKVGMAAMQG